MTPESHLWGQADPAAAELESTSAGTAGFTYGPTWAVPPPWMASSGMLHPVRVGGGNDQHSKLGSLFSPVLFTCLSAKQKCLFTAWETAGDLFKHRLSRERGLVLSSADVLSSPVLPEFSLRSLPIPAQQAQTTLSSRFPGWGWAFA